MRIEKATLDDIEALASLKWRDEYAAPSVDADLREFTEDLGRWWTEHRETHFAFVARTGEGVVVGVAWIALLPRVPRPGSVRRHSADLQSVFVLPTHRGKGIGAAVVSAAYRHAVALGAAKVTVSSSARAVPLYRRLGFGFSPLLFVRSTDQ